MSGKRKQLTTYASKRDFRKTPEPSGRARRGMPEFRDDHNPMFVVQQHAARTLHWDFRIEVEGVLKSWAVPRGPSTDPGDKRLAVATEDHPLDYADFEGVIPEGEYGAGTVIVWDAGPYRNLSEGEDGEEIPIAEALENGKAAIWLEGKKLRGGYALVHSELRGDPKNWLLVKMDDEGADARRKPTRTEPRSVLSRRTLEEVADEEWYDEDTLERLGARLAKLERRSSQFADEVKQKGAHFVTPELVGEFGFTEWTDDGKLRHPRFVGLRTDKDPEELHRERPGA